MLGDFADHIDIDFYVLCFLKWSNRIHDQVSKTTFFHFLDDDDDNDDDDTVVIAD